MSNELILICYNGDFGSSDIRTFYQETILYISLRDVMGALNQENREINESHVVKSMVSVINAQRKALDPDEYVMVPVTDGSYAEEEEVFVTQPGLYRVLSSDRSYAGKKFQRWLFHEVVPALTKYGEYPAPLVSQDSDVKRLAKTLLLEIEAREELERKTQEKFLEHEHKLNQLGQQLHSIESDMPYSDLMSVSDFCERNLIDKTHEQLIFGWCIKIAAEENEPTKKKVVSGVTTVLFPPHVITAAVKNAKGK
ncbi:BRO-N domain-containing protein [Vibrio diabolicus]|uniref:BRO-N domain-containing protein n=1 Tax=Vibrio diabolicus TaxID=50719 RepID=UPI00211AE70E|nr:Bro-N domain-containing protein [Vibrio diabolicus]MCG6222713.1 Bro-N domain-containing protein [Vibrio diabolicus]